MGRIRIYSGDAGERKEGDVLPVSAVSYKTNTLHLRKRLPQEGNGAESFGSAWCGVILEPGRSQEASSSYPATEC